MATPVGLILVGLLLMVGWMSLFWVLHRLLNNAGVVDVGWAGGLVVLAGLYSALGAGFGARRGFLFAVVALWGLRLALHLLVDRVIGKPEDARYAQLREEWKNNLPLKLFLFFQMQGLLDVLLSLPFLVLAFDSSSTWRVTEILGLVVWAVALIGEGAADRQLKAFKRDPSHRGQVCQVGLWNYSRHPNYFFEWLIWVAYALMAWGAPYGPVGLLSPLLMLYFLYKVTGIPATEAQAIRTKGDAYRQYQATTSAFVPWFKTRPA